MSESMLSLLTTKLVIPPPRRLVTNRPRLSAQLNQVRRHQLSLVLAPAGFGKTTLVSSWLAKQSAPDSGLSRTAWLSLDSADNQTARFWRYSLAALQTVESTLESDLLPMLDAESPTEMALFLTGLINQLAALPEPILWVIDDYHLIEQSAIHAGLTFLLDNPLPQLQVILVSRVEPPLPLARWRMQGRLLTVQTADLRFTKTETSNFLTETMHLDLSADDIGLLESRTEGWVAGLQLAALALQGSDQRPASDLIANFGGGHRYILDYLATEVLNQQPPEIEQFLLRTAILDRLTADLCEAVLHVDKHSFNQHLRGQKQTSQEKYITAQAMLEQIETANLFIIPLDDERRWYRYHALFADFLRHRLKQSQPDLVPLLHQQAATWCEQNGFMAEALTHALEAADVERATRLVIQTASRLLSRSEIAALMSWLNALSDEIKRSQTRLSLFQAWALLVTGQVERVEARLQQAEAQLQQSESIGLPNAPTRLDTADLRGEVTTIRGTMAYLVRDVAQAVRLYRQALTELSAENLFLRGAVSLNLGLAYSWQENINKAAQAFQQAHQINHTTGNLYVASVALWNLAQLRLEQGRLHQADDLYSQIAGLATVHGQPILQQNQPSDSEKGRADEAHEADVLTANSFSLTHPLHPDLSGAYVGRGYLLYEQNQLQEASQQLKTGVELARQATDSVLVMGHIHWARVKQAQGDVNGAQEQLYQAESTIRREKIARYWGNLVATWQARLWLAQGNLEATRHWASSRNIRADQPDQPDGAAQVQHQAVEYLLLVRLILAEQNQTALPQAQTLLDLLHDLADRTGRLGWLIEVLILRALTLAERGRSNEALTALNRALSLAEPEGYVRLFVDEGAPLAQLLRRIDSRERTAPYAATLLTAFGSLADDPTVTPLLDPLSERELEILQLVADGLSNKNIGQNLFLTTGTVKWHVSNIYSKLSVKNRTQAVAKARALRLI
ncbi:LuxR C-terminal-related transcriptional regulator [Anaerolineales bacterium HSG25]|nr:LuxR C-terminal-related transcriptional regulator [Anaerolineales bacterium HSG25]